MEMIDRSKWSITTKFATRATFFSASLFVRRKEKGVAPSLFFNFLYLQMLQSIGSKGFNSVVTSTSSIYLMFCMSPPTNNECVLYSRFRHCILFSAFLPLRFANCFKTQKNTYSITAQGFIVFVIVFGSCFSIINIILFSVSNISNNKYRPQKLVVKNIFGNHLLLIVFFMLLIS